MKAALEGIFHMLPPLRLVSSVKMGKWENLIYNSLLCLLNGAVEERGGVAAWVSCLG